MAYPRRPGLEADRLQLIWDIYNWTGSNDSGALYCKGGKPGEVCNKNREHTISWDLCQIFAAIAGGYVIELSAHYKGVRLLKKNKSLWTKVSKFVKLKTGQGCLPYDYGSLGEKWEAINGINFVSAGS